jgi:hypothetical protein
MASPKTPNSWQTFFETFSEQMKTENFNETFGEQMKNETFGENLYKLSHERVGFEAGFEGRRPLFVPERTATRIPYPSMQHRKIELPQPHAQ